MTRILNELIDSFLDYPDNESIAICVVFMGCDNNCPGCQNPLFQDPNFLDGTRSISDSDLIEELQKYCLKNDTNKIVLSGGDPLFPTNIATTKHILEALGSEYDICIYTGHSAEYAKQNNITGFKFLKAGFFDKNNKRNSSKTDEEMTFASPNQKLYDENYNLLSKDGVYKFKN